MADKIKMESSEGLPFSVHKKDLKQHSKGGNTVKQKEDMAKKFQFGKHKDGSPYTGKPEDGGRSSALHAFLNPKKK